MSSNYPNGLDSLAINHADGVGEVIHAATINDQADAINKIEAELGVTPSGLFSDVTSRFTRSEQKAQTGKVLAPEEYGAVGDGVTDDTAAFQAMIDAAYTADKSMIFNLGAKTYLLDSAPRHDRRGNSILSLTAELTNKSTTWVGAGPAWPAGKTILKCTRTTDSYASGPATTLSAQLTAGATSATLTNAGSFPNAGMAVVAGEVIKWTSKTGNTLNGVTRGQVGTADGTRANGSTITVTYGPPSVIGSATNESVPAAPLPYNFTGPQRFKDIRIELPESAPICGIDGIGFGGFETDGCAVVYGDGTSATTPHDDKHVFGLRGPTSSNAGHVLFKHTHVFQAYAAFVITVPDHLTLHSADSYKCTTAFAFQDVSTAHPLAGGYALSEHDLYSLSGWNPVAGAVSPSATSGGLTLANLVLDVERGDGFEPAAFNYVGVCLDANNRFRGEVRVFVLGFATVPVAYVTGTQKLNFVAANKGTAIPALASATFMNLNQGHDSYQVDGTTTIVAIDAGPVDKAVRLIFSSTAQMTDGSNLKLNGNFTGAGDRTITLLSNGTNWYETGRSAN